MIFLDDTQLFRSFSDASLPAASFDHRAHVRAGFIFLARHPDFGEAAVAFRAALRRFTQQHGAAGKYHETLTWVYLALIAERMRGEATSEEFLAHNPDLLAHRGGPLDQRYDLAAIEASPEARRTFLLPRAR